ncbi:MAG: hypothetical protein ACJ8AG_10600 [Ktedonobacteraceae bacterium]
MWRDHDPAHIVVEEEKRGTSTSIHVVWVLGGALPVDLPMPFRKG